MLSTVPWVEDNAVTLADRIPAFMGPEDKEVRELQLIINAVVTEFNFNMLAAPQASESERWAVETKNMTLFRKPADQEDGRLMSQSNHLVGVWMLVSVIESEREKQWGTKVKRQKREGEAVKK